MSESPLMAEAEVLAYLGVSKAGLTRIMVERGLRRHRGTRVFSRKQVEAIAEQIEQEIMSGHETSLGPDQQKMGGQPRFRTKARLV